MTSEREPAMRQRAMLHPSDLDEVKEAVYQLRASSPESALADLVEEKIRAIESGSSIPSPGLPLPQERRLFS